MRRSAVGIVPESSERVLLKWSVFWRGEASVVGILPECNANLDAVLQIQIQSLEVLLLSWFQVQQAALECNCHCGCTIGYPELAKQMNQMGLDGRFT